MAASDGQRTIVIVGGGIIGCASAYYLTRHPAYDPTKHKITLLEADKIAGAASGKAGGLLALWAYPASLVPLSYRLHQELAAEHNGAERWGYRGVHCGQVECTGRQLVTAQKDGDDDDAAGTARETGAPSLGPTKPLPKRDGAALAKLRATAGLPPDLDWLHASAVHAYEEMGDPTTTAQVHPRLFTTAIAALARDAGVQIREDTPVTALTYSADGKRVTGVETAGTDRLPATDVLLCAGPWTRSLLPAAPIAAVRAHSITLRPAQPVSGYALFTQLRLPRPFAALPAFAGRHVAPELYARPDGEVYACGEGDSEVPLPEFSRDVRVDAARCEALEAFAGAISEELRTERFVPAEDDDEDDKDGEKSGRPPPAVVTTRQACYLPSVSSARGGGDAPLVGFTGVQGLLLAAGHTCWGIQNGPATGKLMSEFVFDGKASSAKVSGLDPKKYL